MGLTKWLLLWSLLHAGRAAAQRARDGCFDRFQMSCDTPRRSSYSVNPEEICTRLAVDIFPTTEVLLDPLLHGEHLNSISADDDLCEAIAEVYPECMFCADDDFLELCYLNAGWVQCGDQPDRQEILEDNENYAFFQTDEDVEQVCQDIDASYQVVVLKDDRPWNANND